MFEHLLATIYRPVTQNVIRFSENYIFIFQTFRISAEAENQMGLGFADVTLAKNVFPLTIIAKETAIKQTKYFPLVNGQPLKEFD